MMEVLTWLSANWMQVVGTAGTVVMGASLIVKALAPLTPTKRDDALGVWLDRVYGWINKLALNPPVKK